MLEDVRAFVDYYKQIVKDDKIVVRNSVFNAKGVINLIDANKNEKAVLHEMTKKIEDIKQKQKDKDNK